MHPVNPGFEGTTVSRMIADVPYWLKTLRLHKYTAMMAEMRYEEMMGLDENSLEARGVTKVRVPVRLGISMIIIIQGARRKILNSISKLKQRPANIRRLEAVSFSN